MPAWIDMYFISKKIHFMASVDTKIALSTPCLFRYRSIGEAKYLACSKGMQSLYLFQKKF